MEIEQKILKAMLDVDHFHNEDGIVTGIASRAIDKGYASLSEKQRAVLGPFLEQACEGIKDPGGHHNHCTATVTGDELLRSIEQSPYYDALLCDDCRQVKADYENEWERIKAQ